MTQLPSLPSFASAYYLLHRANADKKQTCAFLLLYFITREAATQGDTWLWFNDDNDDDTVDVWGLCGGHWCVQILRRALPYVDDRLGQTHTKFGSDILELTQCEHTKHFITLLQDFYAYFAQMSLDEWYQFLSGCFFCGEACYFVLSDWHILGFGLWLNRFWRAEHTLAKGVYNLMHDPKTTPIATPAGLNKEQQHAICVAHRHRFAIITGGPGTGKTHTIGQLVAQLLQDNPALSLALAAPTGKAAQRVQSALIAAVEGKYRLPKAQTLHRLLGMGADGVPMYHAQYPLPYELVIVDEASMLGAVLASQLLEAIKEGGRLILLGDAKQLAAVEAGAVLNELCQLSMMQSRHVNLTQSRRFDDTSSVGRLASIMTQPLTTADKFDRFVALLGSIKPTQPANYTYQALIDAYKPYFAICRKLSFKDVLDDDDLATLFLAVNRYRVLTASHLGKMGDERINEVIALAHVRYNSKHSTDKLPLWYSGLLVMVSKNNYQLGLFNGDMGVCLYRQGRYWVFFEGRGVAQAVLANDLGAQMVNKAYAITIHKSQGSEFSHVAVCFDESNERLLSEELLYTAITRAKDKLSLFASERAILLALQQSNPRKTGLFYLMNHQG